MGVDQVAAIRPLIAELELDGEGTEYCARFEVPGAEVGWAEVVRNAINVAYPHGDDPVARLADMEIELPAGSSMQEWRPGIVATFALEAGIPSRAVARFVDRLLETLPGSGDDHPLDASVVKLKQQ